MGPSAAGEVCRAPRSLGRGGGVRGCGRGWVLDGCAGRGIVSWRFCWQLGVDSGEFVPPLSSAKGRNSCGCSHSARAPAWPCSLTIGEGEGPEARKVLNVEVFKKNQNKHQNHRWPLRHLEMPGSHREGAMALVVPRRKRQQFPGAQCCRGVRSVPPPRAVPRSR